MNILLDSIRVIEKAGASHNRSGNRWIPHAGNFDTFFSNDKILKKKFLNSVFSTFNDGIERYFVPEVNSGEYDLKSIVTDMKEEGFVF